MQAEEPVVFKMDVSNKEIKRKAMKVVCKFSGITLIDIKEQGLLKIRGNFDKEDMGIKLQKIDKFAAIIKPKQKAELSHHSGVSSSPNRNDNPKTQIDVFKFEVLGENILREAYTVIWEFPGVTSVEVKEGNQLEVIGEFNNIEVIRKLKKIDESVIIAKVGEAEVEEPKRAPYKSFKATQPNAGPKADVASSSGVPKYEKLLKNKGTFIGAGARAPERVAAPKAKANGPIQGAFGAQNFGWNDQIAQRWDLPVEEAKAVRIARENAENLRIERENAEKRRIEKEKVERQRIERENAEKRRIEKEKAERQRVEREKAERQRVEKEKAERQRIEKEKAERRRVEREKAEKQRVEEEKAERRRVEKANAERREKENAERRRREKAIADNQRTSTWNTGSGTSSQALTQGSMSYSTFVPSSSSMRNPYSSMIQSSSMGNHSQSSQSSSMRIHAQFAQSSSMRNPYSSTIQSSSMGNYSQSSQSSSMGNPSQFAQSSRTSRFTQNLSSGNFNKRNK